MPTASHARRRITPPVTGSPPKMSETLDVDDYARVFPASGRSENLMRAAFEKLTPNEGGSIPSMAWADETLSDPSAPSRGLVCYLRITLSRPPADKLLGWVIATRGSAEQEIDLELGNTQDSAKAHTGQTLGLAVNLCPLSGLLAMSLMDTESNVIYLRLNEEKKLQSGEKIILTERRTTVRVQGFEFIIEYAIPDHRRAAFFKDRHDYLEKTWPLSREFVIPALEEIYPHSKEPQPGPGMTIFAPIAAGAHGMASIGVAHRGGHLLAVKRGLVQECDDKEERFREISINNKLKGCPGLLVFQDTWCAHPVDMAQNCSKECDQLSGLMEFALFNFGDKTQMSKLEKLDQLDAYFQTLTGVCEMAKKNIMHRDLTEFNMVLICVRPAVRAAIIDFGKATTEKESNTLGVTPMKNMAPEVWRVRRKEQKTYDKAIDVWAWAFTVAKTLGLEPNELCDNFDEEYLYGLPFYLRIGAFSSHWKGLIKLLQDMLSPDPRFRPTAEEALENECWAPVKERRDAREREERETKKAKLSSSD